MKAANYNGLYTDHRDTLEQAISEPVGVSLNGLSSGTPVKVTPLHIELKENTKSLTGYIRNYR